MAKLTTILTSLSAVQFAKKSFEVSRQIKAIRKEMDQKPEESIECYMARLDNVQVRYRNLRK